MENNTLAKQLCEIVRTRQEADLLKEDLEKLSSALFNTKTNPANEIDLYIPFDKKEKILSLLQTNGIGFQDLDKTQKFLSLIQESLSSIPVISLQIAFEPKKELIGSIQEWFFLKLKREVLLDINIKKELLGGTVIINNGVFRDYSLKKKIEEQFQQKAAKPSDTIQAVKLKFPKLTHGES